jgi:hypothetical protein
MSGNLTSGFVSQTTSQLIYIVHFDYCFIEGEYHGKRNDEEV